ncbi:molybdenum cofactor guanylyltransferase [Cohnella endophytica]|uniref:Probable molybdenum cofactor guanylyltransferase n=1 Tax=Cohnella endophytica TaxID=2419778 RepID=A0A494XZC8_9BACL|nr:molybdenum cofactor guanylyltransferase [Cohnella endophytica]RKP55108.1 molybdenum cofactor guanylyltransferase [Cohnella endophytica]
MTSDRSVVILAGGQGRRMGGVNKALLPLGGETLLERQLREARKWSDEIIIVANEPISMPASIEAEARVVTDIYPGDGPIAGIHAGLSASSRPYVWVLACDHPYPNANAAERLLERMNAASQAAIPIILDRPQPLHAVYRKEVASEAEAMLAKGQRRLTELLDKIEWVALNEYIFAERGIRITFADDIDTPEHYEREKRLLRMEQQ